MKVWRLASSVTLTGCRFLTSSILIKPSVLLGFVFSALSIPTFIFFKAYFFSSEHSYARTDSERLVVALKLASDIEIYYHLIPFNHFLFGARKCPCPSLNITYLIIC
ncbi:hypothetical protein THOG10_290049 [Vibrio rotiferianus]|nr:hypothetical protein THOG10_290049 [Vibrio rotiferianus]